MNFLEIHRSIRIEEKLKKNAKGGRFHRVGKNMREMKGQKTMVSGEEN